MRVLRAAAAVAAAGTITCTSVVAFAELRPSSRAAQPDRILDTRIGRGAPRKMVQPGETLRLTVPAPEGTTSASINLTAADAVANGHVTAWPCDDPLPETSVTNFTTAGPSANLITVKLSGTDVCFQVSQPVNLIGDLMGTFDDTSGFGAFTPHRLVDTRQGSRTPLGAGEEMRVTLAGTPGVDGDDSSVALNITVTQAAANGYVVAYPCGNLPLASTVNFRRGEDVPNFTFVGMTGGEVCLKSSVTTHIIVDSFGAADGTGDLQVQQPDRLLDTRQPSWPYGPVLSRSKVTLRVAGLKGVANDAAAALLTVTAADANGVGYVTVWPCDQPLPNTSLINLQPGGLRSNLALVDLSDSDGTVCLRSTTENSSPVSLIVDAVGYISGGPARDAPSETPIPPELPDGGQLSAGGQLIAGAEGALLAPADGEPKFFDGVGAFRIDCEASHISNDDPIVFPGQPGATHLHTFFGNTAVNAFSNAESIRTSGGSTCAGGTLNRTGYWVPSMMANGSPLVPERVQVYYKSGYGGVSPNEVQPFPEGLRMVTGNAAATSPQAGNHNHYECRDQGGSVSSSIPSCPAGSILIQSIEFAQCWDGVNLDSPDHKSHMAYPTWPGWPNKPGGCIDPRYPVALPVVTLNVWYTVPDGQDSSTWRLSSDKYDGPGGYSSHADWWNGWDPATEDVWLNNCVRAGLDCGMHLLGNGQMLGGVPQAPVERRLSSQAMKPMDGLVCTLPDT